LASEWVTKRIINSFGETWGGSEKSDWLGARYRMPCSRSCATRASRSSFCLVSFFIWLNDLGSAPTPRHCIFAMAPCKLWRLQVLAMLLESQARWHSGDEL